MLASPQFKGLVSSGSSPIVALHGQFRWAHQSGTVPAARSLGREEQIEEERVPGEVLVWEAAEN